MQAFKVNTPKKPGIEMPSVPGFLRRMCAVFYDALLLLAVLFFATAIALPFNGGLSFSADQYYFSLYLFAITYCFYVWFWVHGETLGLKAWKIKLCNLEGDNVNLREATIRFFAAILSWGCLGLGFFWCLFDRNKRSWHDHLSKTQLRLVSDEKISSPN